MAYTSVSLVSEPSASSCPSPESPHASNYHQQEPAEPAEPAIPQHMSVRKVERPRLPRVPRATDDCRHPWTLDQINDWFGQFYDLGDAGIFRTFSESDDYVACIGLMNRQSIDFPSDTEVDDDEDATPPPVQLYRSRRGITQRPLSPPRTPPHLKGSKAYKKGKSRPTLKPNASKVEKTEAKTRIAPRRPLTRSQGSANISLHHRKGYIRYWRVSWQYKYIVISYDKYLRDYNQDLHKERGTEQLDYSYEDPNHPYKTHWQRETCRRAKVHDEDEKYWVTMPTSDWKGHI